MEMQSDKTEDRGDCENRGRKKKSEKQQKTNVAHVQNICNQV